MVFRFVGIKKYGVIGFGLFIFSMAQASHRQNEPWGNKQQQHQQNFHQPKKPQQGWLEYMKNKGEQLSVGMAQSIYNNAPAFVGIMYLWRYEPNILKENKLFFGPLIFHLSMDTIKNSRKLTDNRANQRAIANVADYSIGFIHFITNCALGYSTFDFFDSMRNGNLEQKNKIIMMLSGIGIVKSLMENYVKKNDDRNLIDVLQHHSFAIGLATVSGYSLVRCLRAHEDIDKFRLLSFLLSGGYLSYKYFTSGPKIAEL